MRARERGFALIIVLWFLVLIGSIGMALILHGRRETAIAHNVRAAADAEALADAGITRAAFNQEDPVLDNRWSFDAATHRIDLPDGYVVIQIADETQKINPNRASAELLAGLFEAAGIERNRARHLGAATADWVSADGAPSDFGAKADAYRAAGKNYGPPNAPLETLDDLNLVLGMTPDTLARVLPYLTLYTQSPEPNTNSAPLIIQRAVALEKVFSTGDEEDDSDTSPAAPAQGAAQAQDGGGAKPEERVIAVDATGHSRDGGVFLRHAVLHLSTNSPQGYDVLDWRRGGLPDNAAKVSG
jgi:general secretion pathway protein K